MKKKFASKLISFYIFYLAEEEKRNMVAFFLPFHAMPRTKTNVDVCNNRKGCFVINDTFLDVQEKRLMPNTYTSWIEQGPHNVEITEFYSH